MQEKYWYLIGGIAIGIVLLGALVFSLKPTGQQSASQLQMVATSTQLLQVAAAPPPTYKLSDLQPGSYTVDLTPAQQFQMQAECTAQAEKTLTAHEIPSNPYKSDYSQQNYYNPQFNECFVLISYTMSVSPLPPDSPGYADSMIPMENVDLMDAYTNADLAYCVIAPNPDNNICWIGDDNQATPYLQVKDYINQRIPGAVY